MAARRRAAPRIRRGKDDRDAFDSVGNEVIGADRLSARECLEEPAECYLIVVPIKCDQSEDERDFSYPEQVPHFSERRWTRENIGSAPATSPAT